MAGRARDKRSPADPDSTLAASPERFYVRRFLWRKLKWLLSCRLKARASRRSIPWSISSPAIWGAAVGNDSLVLGWFRDAASEPPDWNIQTLSGQSVRLTPPGSAAAWKVDFYDTVNGTTIISSTTASRSGKSLTIKLPDFTDDIAFKLTALQP